MNDEGPGIPDEDMPHVFEKFYRGAMHVRKTQGTGLGLAIVKHIVESHGGLVSAFSPKDQGTTIRIVLPREFKFTTAEVVDQRAREGDPPRPAESSSPKTADVG